MTINELLANLNALKNRYYGPDADPEDDPTGYAGQVADVILAADPNADAAIVWQKVGDREDEWIRHSSDEVQRCDVETEVSRYRVTLDGRRYVVDNITDYHEDDWTAEED